MSRLITIIFLFVCAAAAAFGQDTTITASHIAYFGGTTVTGQMCLTPTNQAGQPINIVTPLGQQVSPQIPLCFKITSGVLASNAIVPDTSQTQPANACYNAVISNFYGAQVAVFPCIQPSGSTWSFDAFVPSSMPAIPALTLPQFKHNGVLNASQTSLNLVCTGCTESPAGTINIPSGGASLPTASGAGLAPLSSGAGTTYTAQPVILPNPGGQQTVAQPNGGFSSLLVNTLNNHFAADGFTAQGYGGIGQAAVAWASSGSDYGLCQVVTHSGTDWISVAFGNGSIAPGTNANVWTPFPSAQSASNVDCAAAIAAVYSGEANTSTWVDIGQGSYTTRGIIEPTGLYAVNFQGSGIFGTYLTYNGSAAVPVISRPAGGSNAAFLRISDMLIDGGATASSIIDVSQINQSFISNVEPINWAPGQDHAVRIGTTPGDSFQVHIMDLDIGIPGAYTNPSQYASISCTPSSGVINTAACTLSNGGSGYGSAGMTVAFRGFQGGTSNKPCSGTQPIGTATIAGGAVTALTVTTNGTSCVGTAYAQVYPVFPVNYGLVVNASDSFIDNVVTYAGSIAGIQNNAANNTFHHNHPALIPVGLQNNESATIEGLEVDSTYQYGIDFENLSEDGTAVYGTNGFVGPRVLPGSAAYFIASGVHNIAFGPQANLCGGTKPTNWQEFVTPSGPIDQGAAWPSGVSVFGNDRACGTVGDYTPQVTSPTILTSTISAASGVNIDAENYWFFIQQILPQNGLRNTDTTVSGLPTASSYGPGFQYTVHDYNSATTGACAGNGGGTHEALAIINAAGSAWRCVPVE
jgi:hypothetical protein